MNEVSAMYGWGWGSIFVCRGVGLLGWGMGFASVDSMVGVTWVL